MDAFGGLPGVLADALPDRFGNAVIKAYFENQGRPESAMSPMQKLLYMGKRGMGALEFRPAIRGGATARERQSLEIAELVEQARRLIEGRTDVAAAEIMRIGSSAGGARPKAVILWNRAKGEVICFNVMAVNQDDHVKNIDFLMDESGRWRLAPAFDMTFARGAGYTRQHQMSLGGKRDGFTSRDLIDLGRKFGIKHDASQSSTTSVPH